ncbi:hypothetical protein Tco_0787861 [Tanacetum coccineum]
MVTTTVAKPWRLCRDGGRCRGGLGGGGEVVMVGRDISGDGWGDDVGGSVVGCGVRWRGGGGEATGGRRQVAGKWPESG